MADWIIAFCAVISMLGTLSIWLYSRANHGLNLAIKGIVLRELTTDHGHSIKDQVNVATIQSAEAKVLAAEAARDSAEALELAKVADGQNKDLLGRQADLKNEFDRFIKHTAANDLYRSKLMQEVVKRTGGTMPAEESPLG